MSTWLKLEESIRNNGKVAEAGSDGALVYVSLLCLHAAKGRGGVIPASCCKPSRLRVEAFAFLGEFDPARVQAAVEACVRAELCAIGDDGTIVLRGWRDEHAVACSHCRKPNPEPSHKTCPTCREARKVGVRKASNDKEKQQRCANGVRRSQNGAAPAQSGAAGSHLAALVSVSVSDSVSTPLPPSGERAAARGASAARAEPEPSPEPETRRPQADDGASPVADLTTALFRTRYRAGIGNAIVRRAELRQQAQRLVPTGLTPAHVDQLAALAAEKSTGDPGGLLSHWLDGDWRGVLDEQLAKQRHQAAATRGAGGDPLEGVYGAEPPKPAAALLDQVFDRAARARIG